jgi:cytochrome c oxidase subunit IV
MTSNTLPAKHGFLFGILTLLALCSIATVFLHLPAVLNNLIIFAVAFAMAGLVVLQYMGLKMEGPLVVWTFLIPVILFAILVVGLMPDIAHTSIEFLRGH